ncbi:MULTISPECIES: recombination-associated protein RdgC [Rheinheimera]|uniref:Recombination-associated protein RdgC n=1 Tax=Rheinheimera marina TaxID=1774958 RepID=A0ABV9JLR2_9GAMM
MWFKNLRLYKVNEAISGDQEQLERQFAEFKFSPCMAQEAMKIGFTSPLHPSFKSFCHLTSDLLLVAVKRQEKVLPGAVVQEELEPKIAAAEQEKGRPLSRKEKQALKEELIQALLPRAFSRSSVTRALYDREQQWLLVDTSSSSKAEEVLALMRKALGSLPALPLLDNHKLNQQLHFWLQGKELPAGFELGNEAELKAPDEEGAKVRFSNHLLSADEVQSHLEDKLVTRLALDLPEQLSLLVCEDSSIKRLKFHEVVCQQNDEMGWDDLAARLDADLLLMHQLLRAALEPLLKNLEQ